MVAWASNADISGVPEGPAHSPKHPSAYAMSTRPKASTCASMKSRRLRCDCAPPGVSLPHAVPASQIQPRCTGSVVTCCVVHVSPASIVVAT